MSRSTRVSEAREVFEDDLVIVDDEYIDREFNADVEGNQEEQDEYLGLSERAAFTAETAAAAPLPSSLLSLPKSKLESHRHAFSRMFLRSGALEEMRKMCLEDPGRLKPAFRHLAWPFMLGLLPAGAASSWEKVITTRRKTYADEREAILKDERESAQLGVEINNPLSQDEKSPWNRYFADKELRAEIVRDVIRTTTSLTLFREQKYRDLMTTILFIYSKKHPEIAYKQGMHEILGVIITLQQDGCLAYYKASESADTDSSSVLTQPLRRTLQTLSDVQYLEHDSFAIFEKFMEKMWDWYFVEKCPPQSRRVPPPPPLSPDGEIKLFSNKRNDGGSEELAGGNLLCHAARRLHAIWTNILKTHDKVLFNYLEECFIIPTTFGTSWTKLLFSRQITEYLILWDAIVATDFAIVDFVVVAMVLAIRPLLIESDANKCNSLLVSKYPQFVDPKYVLAKALHIWRPLEHPQPTRSSFKFGFPYLQERSKLKKPSAGNSSNMPGKKLLKKFAPSGGVATGKKIVEEKKMVRVSGSSSLPTELKVQEDMYDFLEDESSSLVSPLSPDELTDRLTQWRKTLETCLKALSEVKPSDNSNRKALEDSRRSIESVIVDLSRLVTPARVVSTSTINGDGGEKAQDALLQLEEEGDENEKTKEEATSGQ